jgi:hypothetical protein
MMLKSSGGGEGRAQVEEYLPSKHKTFSTISKSNGEIYYLSLFLILEIVLGLSPLSMMLVICFIDFLTKKFAL